MEKQQPTFDETLWKILTPTVRQTILDEQLVKYLVRNMTITMKEKIDRARHNPDQ